jgi:hypothetical protein
MVHNNPGEAPYESKFNDPEVIKKMGYNGKVFFLFESAQLAVNWDDVDPDILPKGSPERKWTDAKAKLINYDYSNCKVAGLQVFCQSDLILFPKRLIEKYDMSKTFGDPNNELTQKYLRILLRKMFSQFPQLDGIVVRIGETYLQDAPFHKGNIQNKSYPEKTIIPLINLLRNEVCVKLNKKVIFRTWYSFDVDSSVYKKVCEAIAPHPNLVFSVKYCEGDFHRGNPFSKILGLGNHKQLIEVQCAREYEGKGAYPNYIAHGIIEGFEEHAPLRNIGKPASIRDISKKQDMLAGIWTWSRGGGWEGPYITNELWCDLNAWVMAQWANHPSESEESIFRRYATSQLKLKSNDVDKFRKLCILSQDAVIRGRRSVTQDIDTWWTRDEYIGWPQLPADSSSVKIILTEKDEAVKMWTEIVRLASEIQFVDETTKNYALTSSRYGLYLYQIYRAIYYLSAIESGLLDRTLTSQWIKVYDNAWSNFEKLKASEPLCATIYSKTLIKRMKAPSADSKVNGLRELYK